MLIQGKYMPLNLSVVLSITTEWRYCILPHDVTGILLVAEADTELV